MPREGHRQVRGCLTFLPQPARAPVLLMCVYTLTCVYGKCLLTSVFIYVGLFLSQDSNLSFIMVNETREPEFRG